MSFVDISDETLAIIIVEYLKMLKRHNFLLPQKTSCKFSIPPCNPSVPHIQNFPQVLFFLLCPLFLPGMDNIEIFFLDLWKWSRRFYFVFQKLIQSFFRTWLNTLVWEWIPRTIKDVCGVTSPCSFPNCMISLWFFGSSGINRRFSLWKWDYFHENIVKSIQVKNKTDYIVPLHFLCCPVFHHEAWLCRTSRDQLENLHTISIVKLKRITFEWVTWLPNP